MNYKELENFVIAYLYDEVDYSVAFSEMREALKKDDISADLIKKQMQSLYHDKQNLLTFVLYTANFAIGGIPAAEDFLRKMYKALFDQEIAN